jgi:hypothetical protein
MRQLLTGLVIALVSSPVMADPLFVEGVINRWAIVEDVFVTKSVRKAVYAQVVAPNSKSPSMTRTRLDEPRSRTTTEKAERSILSWIARFPVIRIVVQPTPPRDYSVEINGEDCPPTEKGLYKVPIGKVVVRIVREGKPPCVWSGQLTDGGKQEVACNF